MAVKVNYTGAPEDLSHLNPIQRYMQKGSLDFQDYLRLGAIVLVYWLLRPYIQKITKKWSEDAQEGEQEQEAYQKRREQAALSHDIRSGKKDAGSDGRTLGEVLDDGTNGKMIDATGAQTSAGDVQQSEVKNRKSKKKGVSFAEEKSEVDKTLDWEDDSEFDPRKPPVVSESGKAQSGDIKQWMEKWTAD